MVAESSEHVDYVRADAQPPRLWRHEDLAQEYPGQRGRWIIPPDPRGWSGILLAEWELTKAGWEDVHPQDETNYVLDGELHVETGGSTVIARKGDSVQVVAGQIGRYWAPRYARMLTVQGPNPTGIEAPPGTHWDIETDGS
ncbi:hypothetical protein CJ179_42410 [Rhodococcus sp. ACS1]|jgi:mannose-6-phosphate isomerase-like protein (cupin superfamily)|uniref:cupin domain-containing protein n=1 Tax=Rhodococcus TaxID=1827 RepID=UPI000BB0CF32|nr:MULTISPECIES: cupin domain-containing protein [Rhodococcus]PBC37026.1 hypothetical protein CJ179_42410 [Rhodococcus sp. ACS1]QSE81185.1 cupin domain-containing protein [Rhodococcus koreensis]